MADAVFDKVEAILTGDLHVPQEKIRPEADLRHDLGLDSFAAVELAYSLEETFSVKVTDDEMASVKTLGDLLNAVRARLAGQSPPAK